MRSVRHPAVLAAALVFLGALVLLPGLAGPGLWEPQEMQVADEAAARADGTFVASASVTSCPARADIAGARTLTPRLAAWGLRHVASSDAGARTPMIAIALLGLLAVFAVGQRLGSTRAGLVAGIVMLGFPLWSLQARMLTSELPGAVGATLIVYGLCVIAAPRRDRPVWLALDLAVAAVALALGGHLAWHGSGALVGLLPPLAAVAFAGAFALPALGAGLARAWRALDPRRDRVAAPIDPWPTAAVALATVATAGVAIWIGWQVFDLAPRTPGTRQLADHSIVTSECWSSAIGGLWRRNVNLAEEYEYHGLFQQAGFGMFPWSILAVISLGALAGGMAGPRRRFAGALLFAWAGAAWICAAVFSRQVGLVVFPGFPACAVAIGVFIDEIYQRRADATRDATAYRNAAWGLFALAVLLGTLVLAKDLQAFPERMTSLLVGGEARAKYPTSARFLFLPAKTWILILGLLAALPFAFDVFLWRPPGPPRSWFERTGFPRVARFGLPVALCATIVLGLFWSHGWHRSVSKGLSSKHIFSVYRDLRKPGDALGIVGSMGNAPRYYAGTQWETLDGRPALLAFLARPTRVFAMAPAGDLCLIHKERAPGSSYFVLDDSNPAWLLLSNQLGGARDHNPIARSLLRERPADLGTPLSVAYDDTIEIVGIKLPPTAARGGSFEVTLTYHVLKPITGAWKVFAHFDNGSTRFPGDHEPVRGRCATQHWQVGDYVVDTFTVTAGTKATPRRSYEMRVGFFQGSFPTYRNMPVSRGDRDGKDRVKVGSIQLR